MSFPEEKLPREFGKYHLIEKVATGGMAELFRAKLYGAGGFEKDLAVKKILPQLSQDADFIQMFMDEAMITVTLNHGNIAQVLDFGEIDGEYFLVMEYVDGVDLQNLLKRITEENDPIPTELAAYVVQEICKGLDYAHHKLGPDGQPLNIVHRDVSPQNVIISFEGQVKLVDFGIARAASRITSTQAGVVKGKMDYMSPEQLLGKGVDAQSDVWAAGVILYELLTLHKPFSGQTPQETMAAITRNSYKPPQKLNRQVNRKLSAVLKKALAGNVKKRFQTAGKMAQSLAAYLHSTGRPPSPLALAQLLRERLPYEKPRTLNPTPVELKHRREHQRTQPPSTPVPKTPAPASEPSFASAPEPPKTPRSTAPEFPKTTTQTPEDTDSTTQASGPNVLNEPTAPGDTAISKDESPPVAGAAEAISFSDLGLPGQYEKQSSTATSQPSSPQEESLDFDDATLVQPTIIDQDDTLEDKDDTAPGSDEKKEPMAELAQAAAEILSDAPALDLPSYNRDHEAQKAPSQSTDDSLASYEDDLLNAPTRLRHKDEVLGPDVNDNTPDESKHDSTSNQEPEDPNRAMPMDEEQWLENSPEQKPDFYDEAPVRPKKQKGFPRAIFLFLMVMVVVGLVGVFIWNQLGEKPVDDLHKPVALQSAKTPSNGSQPIVSHSGESATDKKDSNHTPAATEKPITFDNETHASTTDKVKTNEASKTDHPKPDLVSLVPPTQKPEPKNSTRHNKLNNTDRKNRQKKSKPRYRKKTAHKVIKARGTGTLKINSEPFSVVYWNGKRMGPTPQMNIKLPAGSHTLELRNEALGLSRRVRVRIVANKVQTVFVELRR